MCMYIARTTGCKEITGEPSDFRILTDSILCSVSAALLDRIAASLVRSENISTLKSYPCENGSSYGALDTLTTICVDLSTRKLDHMDYIAKF